MELDRAKFLLLVASITACGGGSKPPEAPPPASSSSNDATDADAGLAMMAPPPETTAATAPPPPAWSHPTPVTEGYVPPPPPPPPSSKIAPICQGSDDVGAPQSCKGLVIDKSCAPFPFIESACEDAKKYMRAKIAERAVACIRHVSPKDLCDALYVYHCKDDALRSACPDASADAQCKTIVGKCPKTSMTDCRQYLSGLNPAGRGEMVSCMTSDCSWGLYSCSEGL